MKQALLFFLLFCNASIQSSQAENQHAILLNQATLHVTIIDGNKVIFTAYDKNNHPFLFKSSLQQNPVPSIYYPATRDDAHGCTYSRFTEEFLTTEEGAQLIVSLAIASSTEKVDMHTFAFSLRKRESPIKYYNPQENTWTPASIKQLREKARDDFKLLINKEQFQKNFPPLRQ